jgi:hypothetical protein
MNVKSASHLRIVFPEPAKATTTKDPFLVKGDEAFDVGYSCVVHFQD